jgi:AraC-like DNA-binding protein
MAKTIRSASVFRDADFPLACMRIKEHGNTAVHGHSFHELVIIVAGQGHHVLDGEEYPLSAGDVFVVRGEMKHGYAGTDHMTLVNILYNPRQLGLPLNELRDLPGYHALFRVQPRLRPGERFKSRFRLSEEDLVETAGMIYRLEQELERNRPGYRFVAFAQLMNLIGFLSRCYSQCDSPAERPLLAMGEVLSYIEQRLRDPIAVRDLTRVARMSESTLNRTFRRVLGRSPLEHVIRARIARASEMLRKGDVRVTEAAFECGFGDSNYFSRQFRKITGMSPRRFRQLSRV